jgi:hypothetical protein
MLAPTLQLHPRVSHAVNITVNTTHVFISLKFTLIHRCRCTHYLNHFSKYLKKLKKNSGCTSKHFMFTHQVSREEDIFIACVKIIIFCTTKLLFT